MKAFLVALVVLFTAGSCSSLPSPAGGLPAMTPTDEQLQSAVTPLPGVNSAEDPASPINTPDFSAMTPPAAEANQFVRTAEADLAKRLDISMDQIHFLKISDIDWQDITQGCVPTPGQVLKKGKLSGYRIWLEADGRDYAYHMGLDGSIFLCPD